MMKPKQMRSVLFTKDYNPRVTAASVAETGEREEMLRLIWNSAIECTADIIKQGTWDSIQLPHLGKFVPNYSKMHRAGFMELTKPQNNGESV